MNPSSVVEVTSASFESEVLQSSVPTLVDFWAPWCGPCRALAPTVSDLATAYGGKVKVCKINIDDNPVAAKEHGISSIPALLLFKDGKAIDELIGNKPKVLIEEMLNKHLV